MFSVRPSDFAVNIRLLSSMERETEKKHFVNVRSSDFAVYWRLALIDGKKEKKLASDHQTLQSDLRFSRREAENKFIFQSDGRTLTKSCRWKYQQKNGFTIRLFSLFKTYNHRWKKITIFFNFWLSIFAVCLGQICPITNVKDIYSFLMFLI